VVWRTPAPAPGFNSPLVWKERLLFTGGDHETREVLCLNATTGELDWRQPVKVSAPTTADGAPEIPEMTGHAASTAATDGERIYAIFATGELVAFTLEGQAVWSKHLGVFDNPYGHAASLACWQDQVIVQLDQGDEDSRKSKIIAFDGRTGEMTWQKARLVGASWVTPIVIDVAAKPQVITLGLPWVISYSASDGAELWRAKSLEGEITPSPVFANGLLFLVDPGMYQLLAFRPDGSGDVTKTHEVWRVDGDMPDITSPVSNGEQVFTLTSDGTLSCFDTSTGAEVWKESLEADGEFQASPSLAADVLLLVSTAGDLIAVEVGSEFRELWRMQLDDEFYASPAFANGNMYLRGNTNVWCLTDSGEEKALQ
jgi:outer membrane protein assembly factor BamB